jgi:tol-pal system protein YbgF
VTLAKSPTRRSRQSLWFSTDFLRLDFFRCGTVIATQRDDTTQSSRVMEGIMRNRLKHLMFVTAAVIFSLDLAVAASPQMQDTSRHLYDRVMEEFKHKDYEAALAGFRFFLELHGQSSLAANAQYWIGECHYRLGHYKEALKSFYDVVSYYPLSPKLAASSLKIGQTYTKMKDHEKARMMYERVIDQYPDSSEAEIARKALEVTAIRNEPTTSSTDVTEER